MGINIFSPQPGTLPKEREQDRETIAFMTMVMTMVQLTQILQTRMAGHGK